MDPYCQSVFFGCNVYTVTYLRILIAIVNHLNDEDLPTCHFHML